MGTLCTFHDHLSMRHVCSIKVVQVQYHTRCEIVVYNKILHMCTLTELTFYIDRLANRGTGKGGQNYLV